jgi:hypothetical protein
MDPAMTECLYALFIESGKRASAHIQLADCESTREW